MRSRVLTLLLAVFTLVAGCATAGVVDPLADAGDDDGARAVGTTTLRGYLPARDGTLLAWNAILPGDGSGEYPVLLTYDGYAAGANADANYAAQFVPKGYALVGLNVRGTGCSGGTFDFFEPVQAKDGYDAIEWIAAQEWSDGKVGMIGKSYPGITQLFTAAEQPPSLVAAAPGHVYGDIYRDVVYPGGVFNYAFAGLWSFAAQPAPGTQAAARAIAGGDTICAQHVAERQATNTRYNPFIQAHEHRFDDELIRERSPYYVADRITVPLYLFQSWQDEQVGVRGVNVVERLQAPYYLTLSNGDHGMYRTPQSLERLERFFDFYLKGEANGFDQEPRVVIWWDADTATRSPAWTTTHASWPVTDVDALTLHLREGGVLSPDAPEGAELPDAYVYPASSTSNGAGYGYYPNNRPPTDALPQSPPPTSLVYTTEPFADDVVVLGPGNFTFWAASTAADTDFQVTLNEVRPDGKVVYVQKGWLRASHRALDGERSTDYRPVHPHQKLELLTPGEPTQMSLELFDLGHAFRAGSSLQLVIEAPTVVPELWGSVLTPVPAVNLVFHDVDRPSALVLPVANGIEVPTPLPPCGSLIRQSCR